ncbi:MAG: protein-L-isoaspartate O-methyltransferase [Candidatus Nanosalina sp.]
MRPKFSSNDELVNYLVRQGRIRSDIVEGAFRRVDRREFVPDEQSEKAYVDAPVPINGVTISAPHIVAEVTELLELSGDEKVLEVGSGSGYQAAILGELAKKVVGVEIDEELAENSREKVPENVEIRTGNGFEKVNESFDSILFSCAADSFNEAENYIKDDGIIVGPVSEDGGQVLKKWKNGELSSHGKVRYVEMQG